MTISINGNTKTYISLSSLSTIKLYAELFQITSCRMPTVADSEAACRRPVTTRMNMIKAAETHTKTSCSALFSGSCEHCVCGQILACTNVLILVLCTHYGRWPIRAGEAEGPRISSTVSLFSTTVPLSQQSKRANLRFTS